MIIGTFEHSPEVGQALAVLEQMGVSRSSIMTVMMENEGERTDKTATFYPNKTTLAFEVGMGSARVLREYRALPVGRIEA
ncbi:hypothetical protein SAMN02799624_01030 [Paenibacillus sp. UNC496MF]|uniref:hypothetical protein n=1 Tax=Paenibacillus sp. UNC496MF TaxID=1502753 RepID=UPI0008E0CBBE|nr:hypothetical protein [Paenibacillus sp. UNC496MF]SFI49300.1 hypothetical protein SAMN02799624_01030 [Paenibacillus sp. UNC496MF]